MGDVTHLASEAVDGNLKLNHLMLKNMKRIDSFAANAQIKIKI